jgi:hypothetical protein
MDTQQYGLFDGIPPHVADSSTSLAAAKSIKHSIGQLHKRVLHAVRSAEPHGLTREQIEHATGLSHQTGSARVRELFLLGRLETRINPETGKEFVRPTSTGRRAQVCFIRVAS